jgi:hypothetical protein
MKVLLGVDFGYADSQAAIIVFEKVDTDVSPLWSEKLTRPTDCTCKAPDLVAAFVGTESGHEETCPAYERWILRLCLLRLEGSRRPKLFDLSFALRDEGLLRTVSQNVTFIRELAFRNLTTAVMLPPEVLLPPKELVECQDVESPLPKIGTLGTLSRPSYRLRESSLRSLRRSTETEIDQALTCEPPESMPERLD